MTTTTVPPGLRRIASRLIGKRILNVRYLSQEEREALGWHQSCVVLELEDDVLLFPSRDDEGNGAGALFGQTPDEELTFYTA